jgi:hypothetical protein
LSCEKETTEKQARRAKSAARGARPIRVGGGAPGRC